MVGVTMPDGTTHADVLEAEKTTCPICKMQLVGIRLDTIWTCPIHAVITEPKSGQCPIDHRDLVQVIVGVSWTCANRPDVTLLTPEKCTDGPDAHIKYTPRIHGDHNSKHGGQFFMAPDNRHHLEGALPRAGRFRLYLYDEFTKPLALDRVKQVRGRVVTKEATEPGTRVVKETAFPLMLSRDGRFLEARIDSSRPPARMAAKVHFIGDGPEFRFDFTFQTFSREPVVSTSGPQLTKNNATVPLAPTAQTIQSTAVTAAAAAAAGRAVGAPAASSDPPDFNVTGNPSSLIQVAIPETVEAIASEMSTRNQRVRQLIDQGAFDQIFLPAFEAKEFALALDVRRAQLPEGKNQHAELAVKDLIRSAWLLDALGDVGNRAQILEAYEIFARSVSALEALFKTGHE